MAVVVKCCGLLKSRVSLFDLLCLSWGGTHASSFMCRCKHLVKARLKAQAGEGCCCQLVPGEKRGTCQGRKQRETRYRHARGVEKTMACFLRCSGQRAVWTAVETKFKHELTCTRACRAGKELQAGEAWVDGRQQNRQTAPRNDGHPHRIARGLLLRLVHVWCHIR